jgi:hypothetical protein
LRLLGLKKPRGRTAKHLSKEWIKYAERLYELECQGVKPEAALKKIMEEDPDNLDRSQLQRWLNNYKKALAETARP